MRVAEQAAPTKLLLAHLYPEWDGVDLVSEASALWLGEVRTEIIEAVDGLKLEI
jgi:ribonuclease BN (tRNA processing enzyme)